MSEITTSVFENLLRTLTDESVKTDLHITALEQTKQRWQSRDDFDPEFPISARCLDFYDLTNPIEYFVGDAIGCVKHKEIASFFDNLIEEVKQRHILKIWESFRAFTTDKADRVWHTWVERRGMKMLPKVTIAGFVYPDDLAKMRDAHGHPYIADLQRQNLNLDLERHRKAVLGLAILWMMEFANSSKQTFTPKYPKGKNMTVEQWNEFCDKMVELGCDFGSSKIRR